MPDCYYFFEGTQDILLRMMRRHGGEEGGIRGMQKTKNKKEISLVKQ